MNTNKAITAFIDDEIPLEAKEAFVEMISLIDDARKDIRVFARKILGLELNSFQEEFLSRSTTPRAELMERGLYSGDVKGLLYGKNIAAPSNQVGKTVMIAIKHIYFNYFKKGLELPAEIFESAVYGTLNISPQSRQTKACFNYVSQILSGNFVYEWNGKKKLNKLHPCIQHFLVSTNNQTGEMRFANNATFYTAPVGHDQASSLAGGQFAYISYDECAQSHHLREELGAKILSRLIKYGVGLDLISTAEVDSPSHQEYFHLVKDGLKCVDGWWAMTGFLDQNVFISDDQREKIKADLFATDKKKYRQVVFGEFVSGGKRFFEQAEIDNMWKLPSRVTAKVGHKYLLVADWGMADTGDPSIFYVLDYTNYAMGGKIQLVSRERIQGGSPHIQFATLRAYYDEYSVSTEDGFGTTLPVFLMDANSLGGVVIKKLLQPLSPKAFDIEKNEALFLLKQCLSKGRDVETLEDGSEVDNNPDFGGIESFYIPELADQLSLYHVDDAKLKQDEVMTLMMGVSYIVKKIPRGIQKKVELNPLAGYNRTVKRSSTKTLISTRFLN